ncbi:Homeobox-leucine zipper protein ROC6 [Capsicum baccatum]|uniref:Homeobox-leucine zipper protein ROC6 n=1 Tax=Capsicum baccatum TaxID=33114 RepID=A0A2G2X6Q3_CAPBA|nr:Homeobox-leucine zipper protein ROC6 [Capsicum baccatum]
MAYRRSITTCVNLLYQQERPTPAFAYFHKDDDDRKNPETSFENSRIPSLSQLRRWITSVYIPGLNEMFPCLISRTSTTDVISSGMGGTRNGALQLMYAELQVLSPLVLVRDFLRFCKQHVEGVWDVVDVSIDTIRETSGALTFQSCRSLPSGCVVQDMPDGYRKIISPSLQTPLFIKPTLN